MLRLGLIYLLITIISCNNRVNNQTSENIKGEVRRLTVSSYSAEEKFGEAEKKDLIFKYTFTL